MEAEHVRASTELWMGLLFRGDAAGDRDPSPILVHRLVWGAEKLLRQLRSDPFAMSPVAPENSIHGVVKLADVFKTVCTLRRQTQRQSADFY